MGEFVVGRRPENIPTFSLIRTNCADWSNTTATSEFRKRAVFQMDNIRQS
jgi:hypothetical protein